MKKEQFQVGMRVVAIDLCDGKDLRGKTGTVRFVSNRPNDDLPIGVEFDEEFSRGHALGGLLDESSKRGRWCECDSLRLLDGTRFEIETIGGETTVRGCINGREVSATAKCAADDTPNTYVGALVALQKAFGIERRDAQAGECVVVVWPMEPHGYTTGDILQMTDRANGINTKTGEEVYCIPHEYAVVRDPAVFQLPKRERKAVCIKAAPDDLFFRVGRIYTVDGDGKIDTGKGLMRSHQLEDARWLAAGKYRFIIIDEDKEEAK